MMAELDLQRLLTPRDDRFLFYGLEEMEIPDSYKGGITRRSAEERAGDLSRGRSTVYVARHCRVIEQEYDPSEYEKAIFKWWKPWRIRGECYRMEQALMEWAVEYGTSDDWPSVSCWYAWRHLYGTVFNTAKWNRMNTVYRRSLDPFNGDRVPAHGEYAAGYKQPPPGSRVMMETTLTECGAAKRSLDSLRPRVELLKAPDGRLWTFDDLDGWTPTDAVMGSAGACHWCGQGSSPDVPQD